MKVRRVEVALFSNGSCTVVPVASEPHMRTPAAVAFTSQDAAFKFETTRPVVEARPNTERLVDVAFVVVVLPKTFPPVNTLSEYVFAIDVDASAK